MLRLLRGHSCAETTHRPLPALRLLAGHSLQGGGRKGFVQPSQDLGGSQLKGLLLRCHLVGVIVYETETINIVQPSAGPQLSCPAASVSYLKRELLHASAILQAKQGEQQSEVADALDLNTCTVKQQNKYSDGFVMQRKQQPEVADALDLNTCTTRQ